MVYNAMKLFMEINPQLFDECSDKYRESEAEATSVTQKRNKRWLQVADMARQHQNGEIPIIPPLTDKNGNKYASSLKIDEDSMTQDSQKRLDALRLQDESGGAREMMQRREQSRVCLQPSLASHFSHPPD